VNKPPKPKINLETMAIMGRYIQQNPTAKPPDEMSKDFDAAMKAAGQKPKPPKRPT